MILEHLNIHVYDDLRKIITNYDPYNEDQEKKIIYMKMYINIHG